MWRKTREQQQHVSFLFHVFHLIVLCSTVEGRSLEIIILKWRVQTKMNKKVDRYCFGCVYLKLRRYFTTNKLALFIFPRPLSSYSVKKEIRKKMFCVMSNNISEAKREDKKEASRCAIWNIANCSQFVCTNIVLCDVPYLHIWLVPTHAMRANHVLYWSVFRAT